MKFQFNRLFIIALFTFIYQNNDILAQCFLGPNGNLINADGSDCVNTVSTAVPFLRIVPDARSAAMGDVGIAISPDANALHFNTSKLAFAKEDLGISATYTPWLRALGLNDVYLAYLTGYKKIDKLQSVGIGLRYFSLGSIDFTDINGNPLGNGKPREFELNVGYARKLSENFSAAVNGKYIYSNLAAGQSIGTTDITPANSGAADFSFTYRKPVTFSGYNTDLTVGLAISNIGTKITYTNSTDDKKDFLPANIGIGAAWDLKFDEYNTFTIAADINKLMAPTPIPYSIDSTYSYKSQSMFAGILNSFSDAPGGFKEEMKELMYSVGVEYWYDRQFAVRAGYFSENATKGNRKYLTLGLGVKYNIFGLNISYLVPTTSQRNPLDNTLRFSLVFDFNAYNPEDEE
ncbi:MAG: type IX secretion system outer membrane channel protein PorV [Saprospiraceae bacterium]|nr:type IX secretion system outer membrane channel protein PorV [Saprospiraceae bacterium]